MKKVLLSLLSAVCLAPLPTLANDLTITYGNEELPDVFVASDDTLINVAIDDEENITGRVWSDADNAWSDAETIFTDTGSQFNLARIRTIAELKSGTIVLAYGDDVVSYSEKQGFQHYTIPFSGFDMVASGNRVTFIDTCSDEAGTPAVARWTETDGFDASTALSNSICTTGDLTYNVGMKGVVLDYYTGVAYDRSNNYAVLDNIDLSGLNYADETDDWDAQGNNPHFAKKINGDVVFTFETSLYGYAYNDATWRSLVTLPDGFSIIGGGPADGEYSYAPLQTEDGKHIFAFTANEDQTEYQIYRWTSAAGWELEKTYSFDESAELVPANIDKSKPSLDWAFWLEDSNTLNIYQWTDDTGYSKRTDRAVTCAGECQIMLDISKKNKVFIATISNTDNDNETAVLAWKPGSDTWESDTLPVSSSNYTSTHVTASGRWIVTYQQDDNSYAVKRWTPDNGWGGDIDLAAEVTYYNDDQLIYVDLAADGTLTINRYSWKNSSATELGAVTSVDTFHDDDSFIYDDHLFTSYEGDEGETVEAISL